MPKERGKRKTDRWGCADVTSLSSWAAGEVAAGFTEGCSPIAAGLCPEILAACRRGCRPERGRPHPPSTRSA